jgi:hypothetical protein
MHNVLATLQSTTAASLGGLRFEIRSRGCLPVWDQQLAWLQMVMGHLMPRLFAWEVDTAHALAYAQHALHQASVAGLFTAAGALVNSPMPAWKRLTWHRLLHCFGITHKWSSRAVLQLELTGAPWGVDDALHPSEVGGGLNLGLLPSDVPVVNITTAMSPHQVARLGLSTAHLFDWVHLASCVQVPDLAPVLRDAAIHTMWRRQPGGKRRQGAMQFTATRSTGGGTVGPLGTHLCMAVKSLVSQDLHLSVRRLPSM